MDILYEMQGKSVGFTWSLDDYVREGQMATPLSQDAQTFTLNLPTY